MIFIDPVASINLNGVDSMAACATMEGIMPASQEVGLSSLTSEILSGWKA
jgi:hypothetical protein